MIATRPLNLADDAWFLQLATRVASGDVLYREVYAPVNPLSVWVSAAAVRLFGSTIWVLNAINLAAWTITLLLALLILRELRLPWFAGVPLAAAMLALNAPGACGPGSAYNPIAQAFLVGGMLLSLLWLRAGDASRKRLLISIAGGLVGGLALANKQNLGLLTLAGFVCTTAVVSAWRRRAHEAYLNAGAAILTAVAVVATFGAVIALQHGLQELLRYGFQGLGTYTKEGTLLYRSGLFGLFRALIPPIALPDVLAAISLSVFLLPILSMGLPAIAWVKTRDSRCYALFVWGTVGLLAAYPRWDIPHLQTGTPLMLLAMAGAIHLLARSPRAQHVMFASLTTLSLGCLAAVIAINGAELARTPLHRLNVPHFEGAYLRYDDRPEFDLRPAVASVRLLTRLGRERRIVILGYRSGFLYLSSGIKNPTPYDYAAGGIIGRRETWEVLELYKRGKVDAVWLDRSNTFLGMPSTEFATWLDREWRPTMRTAYGTLYEPTAEWRSLRSEP